jgi:hypothetical protein
VVQAVYSTAHFSFRLNRVMDQLASDVRNAAWRMVVLCEELEQHCSAVGFDPTAVPPLGVVLQLMERGINCAARIERQRAVNCSQSSASDAVRGHVCFDVVKTEPPDPAFEVGLPATDLPVAPSASTQGAHDAVTDAPMEAETKPSLPAFPSTDHAPTLDAIDPSMEMQSNSTSGRIAPKLVSIDQVSAAAAATVSTMTPHGLVRMFPVSSQSVPAAQTATELKPSLPLFAAADAGLSSSMAYVKQELIVSSSHDSVTTMLGCNAAPDGTVRPVEVDIINIAKHSRAHKCDHCGKSFRSQSHLETHVSTVHLKRKPFKCDVCGKAFGQKSNLKLHQLTHSGEKPHQCDLCDYRAGRKIDLQTHQITHSGEKPHQCDLCDYRAAKKSDINRHRRAVHLKEKQRGCNVRLCGSDRPAQTSTPHTYRIVPQ